MSDMRFIGALLKRGGRLRWEEWSTTIRGQVAGGGHFVLEDENGCCNYIGSSLAELEESCQLHAITDATRRWNLPVSHTKPAQ